MWLYITRITRYCLFQAHMFSSKSGGCAAFLSNYNVKSASRVIFNGKPYKLPPWSISILPDCKNAVFNTAKVSGLFNGYFAKVFWFFTMLNVLSFLYLNVLSNLERNQWPKICLLVYHQNESYMPSSKYLCILLFLIEGEVYTALFCVFVYQFILHRNDKQEALIPSRSEFKHPNHKCCLQILS